MTHDIQYDHIKDDSGVILAVDVYIDGLRFRRDKKDM